MLPPAKTAPIDRCLGRWQQSKEIFARLDRLKTENARYRIRIKPVQGAAEEISLEEIVRTYPANQLGLWGKLGVYASRWREFLFDDPLQSNSAGGYFPAIWGTIAMTLIMTLFAVPFGVLAALYLREYAKPGPVTSAVRIAINNLAGVPSIVFGAFGLGFFCYGVGKFIDGGPENSWPAGTWFMLLGFAVAVGVAAFFVGLIGRPGVAKTRSAATAAAAPAGSCAMARFTCFSRRHGSDDAILSWLLSCQPGR